MLDRSWMRSATTGLLVVSVAIPASLALGRSSGAMPGINGIPANATTAFPACGACHGRGMPGEGGPVTIRFQGTPSIRKGAGASFTLAISSPVSGSRGGFALTTDRGSFSAGSGSQVGNAGRSLTHTSSASRSWSYSFQATQTGLVQWHAVGNTVNGDFNTKGDSWGWYGPDPAVPGTPYRVFVNDTQIFPYGKACAGEKDFEPLLGAAGNATRGQGFPVEIHNVPPGTAAIGIFGFSNRSYGPFQLPLPLAALGAPGCELNTSMDLLLPTATTGSGAGNGKGVFNWAIPNVPGLQGVQIYLSALVLDRNANAMGITNANGLRALIQ